MQEIKRRACGLIRVSTEEQARGGYGLKFQEEDIRKFCERNNLELLKVFRDEGYSGSTADRPGFKEMMEWGADHRFDVLVVWKLDRLFRDTKLTLQTVDALATVNVEFRSVQEAFTHDSNGRFLLTIFAAGAEKERKDINLRMYSGRLAAARRGILVNGGSTPPYGYRYDKTTKKLVIVKEEAAVVRQIFQWCVDERLSLYKIQCRLNDMRVPTKYDRLGRNKRMKVAGWWHKRTIGRLIENETYTGHLILRKYKRGGQGKKESNLRPKDDWIAIDTPQIITEQVFDQARKQLLANSANSFRNTKKHYMLGKLLVCGNDGRKMQVITMPSGRNGSDVKYYYCGAVVKSITATPCDSRRVREDRVLPPVWDTLKGLLSNPSIVLRQLAEYQEEKTLVSEARARKQTLEENTTKTEDQLQRLAEVYVSGAVDKAFYDKERRRLRDQADQLNRELKRIEAVTALADRIISSEGAIHELYEIYKNKLESASDDVRREILHAFIDSIVVRGEDLEIEVGLPSMSAIAGQSFCGLPRNDMPSLFLKARLLPLDRVIHKSQMQETPTAEK